MRDNKQSHVKGPDEEDGHVQSGCICVSSSAGVVAGRNGGYSTMSHDPDDYGIPPYRPERDDELAQEARRHEMMQTTDEPIRPETDEENTEQATFANVTEEFY